MAGVLGFSGWLFDEQHKREPNIDHERPRTVKGTTAAFVQWFIPRYFLVASGRYTVKGGLAQLDLSLRACKTAMLANAQMEK